MATEYYKDDSEGHEWRWRVTADDGTPVGRSTEGYTRRENAQKNLESLPDYCGADDIRTASARRGGHPLEFYDDDRGRWRWRITAGNGEIVHASIRAFDSLEEAKQNLIALAAAAAKER